MKLVLVNVCPSSVTVTEEIVEPYAPAGVAVNLIFDLFWIYAENCSASPLTASVMVYVQAGTTEEGIAADTDMLFVPMSVLPE